MRSFFYFSFFNGDCTQHEPLTPNLEEVVKDFFTWWWKVNTMMVLPVTIATGGVCFGLWGKAIALTIVIGFLPIAIRKA